MTAGAAHRSSEGPVDRWLHAPVRRTLVAVGMVAAWCALWRDLSMANVFAGLLLAAAANGAAILVGSRGGVRLWPLARLVAMVIGDLVRSTVGVAAEILRPSDQTEEGIVAVELPVEARDHLLMLVVAITLTPGTAVVDADPTSGTLYVHLLHMGGVDDTRRHIELLTDRAIEAFPNPGVRRSITQPSEPAPPNSDGGSR